MSKKRFRPIVHAVVDGIAFGFLAIANLIPFALFLKIGRGVGIIFYFVSSRHRRAAGEAMVQAFGGTVKEHTPLIKHMFADATELLLELMAYTARKIDAVQCCVGIEGEEHLKAALARGKGVIAITAHMGCFPAMFSVLAARGYPMHVMLRPLRHERLGKQVDKQMHVYNVEPIYSYPRHRAIFDSLKALKKNGIIEMLMDQNFGTGGVWVDFFGKLAATPTGPVVMAMRSGAVLVPMYTVREASGRHRIVIEKPYDLVTYENEDEMILRNVANLTKIIEGWIRKYPRNWFWFHQRWKSRPSEKVLSKPFVVDKDPVVPSVF